MAKRKNQNQTFTESDFAVEFKDYLEEVKNVQGIGQWPRLPGFIVVGEVKDMADLALELFQAGKVKEATLKIHEAWRSLTSRERWYFRNSPDKKFVGIVQRMRKEGVAEDLVARLTKAIDEINHHARIQNFDLEVAVNLYTDALHVVDAIYDEDERRKKNRLAKQQVEVERQQAERAIEKARQQHPRVADAARGFLMF